MAHLLQDHIVPVLPAQCCLSLRAQTGFGVQLLRKPCPASGVVHHLCAGQLCQHPGHIVCKDQAVAQHQNAHSTAPYPVCITCIIYGCAGGNKPCGETLCPIKTPGRIIMILPGVLRRFSKGYCSVS